MKNHYKLISLFILVFSVQMLNAQPWIKSVESDNPTFQEIQKSFSDYWKDKPIEKGKGYKQFKRWEWYWEQRILSDGTFPSPSVTWGLVARVLDLTSYRSKQNASRSRLAIYGTLNKCWGDTLV